VKREHGHGIVADGGLAWIARRVAVQFGSSRMPSSNRAAAAVLLVACLLSACSGGSRESRVARPTESFVLYEGLPHPVEGDLFDIERKTKPAIEIHDFLFYRQTLDPSASDVQALKALLSDASTFKPWEGEKKCGGFHPDYAVNWSVDNKRHLYLICFGCNEIKVYGSTTGRYDIGNWQLEDILARYSKNRPPHRGFGP
jgi:hypothetical protein